MEMVNVIYSEDVIKEKNSNEQEIKYKRNQFSIFIFFINIISIASFSGLFILSWLSLFWLYKFNSVFTFFRHDNVSEKANYFPIQISSLFLFIIFILTLLTITITYIFYIRAIFKYKNFDYLNDRNKNYIIPISLNLLLFYIGELSHNKSDIFHIYYFIGFFCSIVSLFYLIKLYYDFDCDNENLDFDNYIKNTLIHDFFYGILIGLDLYYLFYVSCQIAAYYTSSVEIKIFMGITVNLFMGLVGIYLAFKLKNMTIALLFELIYYGIINFHYNFKENERNNINLEFYEVILSCLFIIEFLFLQIYIFIYKKNNNY